MKRNSNENTFDVNQINATSIRLKSKNRFIESSHKHCHLVLQSRTFNVRQLTTAYPNRSAFHIVYMRLAVGEFSSISPLFAVYCSVSILLKTVDSFVFINLWK